MISSAHHIASSSATLKVLVLLLVIQSMPMAMNLRLIKGQGWNAAARFSAERTLETAMDI